MSIGRQGRFVASAVLSIAQLRQGDLGLPGGLDVGFTRLQVQTALVTVQNPKGSIRLVEHRRTGSHDSRDIQGAGDDGRMRGGPTAGGAKAQDAGWIQSGCIRWGQIVGQQDDLLLRHEGLIIQKAAQQLEHTGAHVV